MLDTDLDASLSQLISDVRGLFGAGPASLRPSPSPASGGKEDAINSSGRFVAPIHGEWHSLGGFAPSMVRYDDDPNAKKGRGHFGVDMSAPAGTPVYAVSNGVVTAVSTDQMGGNFIGIQHSNNIWSYYAHLSSARVHKGDKVDTNTIIGTVGNTGNAGNPNDPLVTQEGGRTWPHLHFGIKERGDWVDPSKYFHIPQYDSAFAKNPSKYQNFWLSEQAKEEAHSFSMKEHNQKRRVAFRVKLELLEKYADKFYRLTSY